MQVVAISHSKLIICSAIVQTKFKCRVKFYTHTHTQ